MKKNVGLIDAIIRFVLAVVVAVFIYRGDITGTLAIVLGIAAAALLITGLIGWCGLYALLGIRTCPKK
ncbi:MAG TPA: DUF2892 domain-containing protein [Bacteroidales bacterium]|nr:DUF2892 domain-containing protein [Bacteroidales bacterium]